VRGGVRGRTQHVPVESPSRQIQAGARDQAQPDRSHPAEQRGPRPPDEQARQQAQQREQGEEREVTQIDRVAGHGDRQRPQPAGGPEAAQVEIGPRQHQDRRGQAHVLPHVRGVEKRRGQQRDDDQCDRKSMGHPDRPVRDQRESPPVQQAVEQQHGARARDRQQEVPPEGHHRRVPVGKAEHQRFLELPVRVGDEYPRPEDEVKQSAERRPDAQAGQAQRPHAARRRFRLGRPTDLLCAIMHRIPSSLI